MNLLDHPLINKYFGCDCDPETFQTATGTMFHMRECLNGISARILTAMQEPIKKGERYLALSGSLEVVEECVATDYEYPEGHSGALRLPDRFQKDQPVIYGFTDKEVLDLRYYCDVLNKTPAELKEFVQPKQEVTNLASRIPDIYHYNPNCKCDCKPSPSKVESDPCKNIADLICYWFSNGPVGRPNPKSLEKELCDLVRLAKEEKSSDDKPA